MKIPIRNIYFLLCYAWDMLEEAELIDASQDDCESAAELFGRVLESGVTYLLKRGLDRGYVTESLDTPSLRGKLDLTTTLKRNLLRRMQVHCLVDSLTYDVPQNQIIKATLGKLVRCENLDRSLRDRLLRLYRRLHDVAEVPLSPKLFSSVTLHRNNAFYGFVLQVCRLIYEARLVDERPGAWRFRDFLREDAAMARLFERFVFNFFKREQTQFAVRREQIKWAGAIGEPGVLSYLPTMNTDISLTSAERKIIVDTKYYRETLQTNFGKQSIRSENLYQLYAYLTNSAQAGSSSTPLEGILLYPTVGQDVDLDFRLQEIRIRVLTVDLSSEWPSIHARLSSLAL